LRNIALILLSLIVVISSGCLGESQQMYVCPSGDTVSNPVLCPKEQTIPPRATQPSATVPPTTTTTTLPPKPELTISTQVLKPVTPFSSGDLSIVISNHGDDIAMDVKVDVRGNDIQNQQRSNIFIDEGNKVSLSIPLTLTTIVTGQKNINIDVSCSNCDSSVSDSNMVYMNINPDDFLPKSPPIESKTIEHKCEKSDITASVQGDMCEITYKIERSFATDHIGYVAVFVTDSVTSTKRLYEEMESSNPYVTKIVRNRQVGFFTEKNSQFAGLISNTGYIYFWKTDSIFFIVASNDNDMALDLIFKLPKM